MNEQNKKSLECLVDPEGFLVEPTLWTKVIAQQLAHKDNITLTEQHWFVIDFLRTYYEKFKHFPSMRILIKLLKNENSNFEFDSLILYQLFPEGPLKQAAKFSGLPKPPHCT